MESWFVHVVSSGNHDFMGSRNRLAIIPQNRSQSPRLDSLAPHIQEGHSSTEYSTLCLVQTEMHHTHCRRHCRNSVRLQINFVDMVRYSPSGSNKHYTYSVLGIFHDDISMFIDKPDPAEPSSTPSDIDIYIRARERGVITLKTGTDLGNAEGSAYGNAQWRNIFGGAETLNVNAATGTRTRSAYQATFEAPILSDPDKRVAVDVLSSATSKPWASHEEVLKGGGIKYSWASGGGSTHQIGYSGVWRQVTGLAGNASPTVRNDAGDTVKSSISHTWLKDERNHPILPNQGYLVKSTSEIAGWGPLKGDVGFWKSEVESSGAVKVPGIPGASLTAGIRAGMLYPLGVGFGTAAKPSRINDRFQLGGPTDVRGFKIGGLGPRDRQDAVGGDVYAASSINLLLPLPRLDISTPLRLQLFANAGRLLALKSSETNTSKSVYGTVAEIGREIPSLAVGIGMVYAHPVARFELNFGLPIVVRKGEETRKGLQFGVGINFL